MQQEKNFEKESWKTSCFVSIEDLNTKLPN